MKQELKRLLKIHLLHPIKRDRTLLKWRRSSFTGVPVVFGNAMPKSGSKLLMQILHGMTHLAPLVESSTGPIRTITVDGRTRSQQEILQDLLRLKPGDVSLGYLHATPVNQTYLTRPDWTSYFIYRDPRDLLVSHIFYAVDMNPRHGMHAYYLPLSMEERLRTAIQGIHQENLNLPDVRTRYERVLGWLDCPPVMPIRFDQLVQERETMLEAILQHFEAAGGQLAVERSRAIGTLLDAMDPKKSPTFRKGQSGGWREHFSEQNKLLFKEVAGDLLIRLGYEKDDNW
jgi:hypothetical protein